MISSARRPGWWALGLCAGLLGAPARGEEGDFPRFLQRLNLPVEADSISYPRAVHADPVTGEAFVSDTRRNRILIFDEDGVFRFEIAGGDAFSAPIDLAVDGEGYIFVLASHDQRPALIELDFDGRFRRELAPEYSETSLRPHLTSVALSPDGQRLYLVDDANFLLWILSRSGEVRTRVALSDQPLEDAQLETILGKVDVYGEAVVLAVPSAGEVWIYDLEGRQTAIVGRKGNSPCKLSMPTAAALDEDGNLVVADRLRMVIARWRPSTNRCLTEYFGVGAAPGYLYYPMDLALGRGGRLFVAQGYEGRVQMYGGFPRAAGAPVDETKDEDSGAADGSK